jgi:hypothetical protein
MAAKPPSPWTVVHIVVDERLRALVHIDSSVFNLVLARCVD